MRHLIASEGLDGIVVDSAGTIGYHVGQPPDSRATEAAARRGIDLSGQSARRVRDADFRDFDYVLAMDRENHADLIARCPAGEAHKVSLFLGFAPELELDDVPDPYYGRSDGFEYVLDLIEEAARGLLEDIRPRLS